jgi:hypothetical protein
VIGQYVPDVFLYDSDTFDPVREEIPEKWSPSHRLTQVSPSAGFLTVIENVPGVPGPRVIVAGSDMATVGFG